MNLKSRINGIMYFTGFKIEQTIENEERVYLVKNKNEELICKCFYWFTEMNEPCLSIEYSTDFNIKDKKRFDRMVEKLNKFEELIVSVEDLRQPIDA